jgi:hypothetical protein
LDASSATFSPVLPIGPFEGVVLALVLVVLEDLAVLAELFPLFAVRLRDVLDEPFRLVDLFDLEPVRLERVLEDRVVWAILLASLGWPPCQLRRSRWRCRSPTR